MMSAELDDHAALRAPPRPRSPTRRARTFDSVSARCLAILHEVSVLPLSTMDTHQSNAEFAERNSRRVRTFFSRVRCSFNTGSAMSTLVLPTDPSPLSDG